MGLGVNPFGFRIVEVGGTRGHGTAHRHIAATLLGQMKRCRTPGDPALDGNNMCVAIHLTVTLRG